MAQITVFSDTTGELSLADTNAQNVSNILDELNSQYDQTGSILQVVPRVVASGTLDFDYHNAVFNGSNYLSYTQSQTVEHGLGLVSYIYANWDFGPNAGIDSRGNMVPYYRNEYDPLGVNSESLLSVTILMVKNINSVTFTISSVSPFRDEDSDIAFVHYGITNLPESVVTNG